MKCTCEDLVNNGDHYCPFHGTFAKAHEPEPTEAAPRDERDWKELHKKDNVFEPWPFPEREAVVGGQPPTGITTSEFVTIAGADDLTEALKKVVRTDVTIFGNKPETPRPEMGKREQLWEVVRGKEADDWGITAAGNAGSSIAQMMFQEDAEEVVALHNAAASGTESAPNCERCGEALTKNSYCPTCGYYSDAPQPSSLTPPNALSALRRLYEETADYIRINNLGDVHHNQSMKDARDVLASSLTQAGPE